MGWALLALACPPQNAAAQTLVAASPQDETLDAFYLARGNRPLWLTGTGKQAQILLDILRTSDADGLVPDRNRIESLEQVLRELRHLNHTTNPKNDRLFTDAFVDHVRNVRRLKNCDMIWVDPELRPSVVFPRRLLDEAAAAPSLEAYLAEMRWTNPIYAGLRRAIIAGGGNRDLLAPNLDRARALPSGSGRYVIVNAAAAQLTMVDGGKAVGTMRVVVGKPIYPTPMMAALIRFTSLNPYWNVPPDLAAERIAPEVIKQGQAFLKLKGYQVLASWDDDAKPIDPTRVNWPAVAAGRREVRIRQLPGPSNAMGQMKFMFPNALGIYLHDTPDKQLLSEASRLFSGGCVRLEDAPRLARWLYEGKPPSTASARPEQRVNLPQPVPVFLTYLTAVPGEGGITYYPDVYHRDRR